jgi:septal ring factor EnvC (AmiA/AmiB activator)
MVEEIDRRVKSTLGKLADYAPWMFVVTVLLLVVLAVSQNSPPQKPVYPPDTRMLQYYKTEAKLRIQIDRNLEQTAQLLARLSTEMDRENYDSDTLLAQIREKREELQHLMSELVALRRKIALKGGEDYEKTWKAWDEG